MESLKSFYKSVMLILLTAIITFLVTGTLMHNKYGEKVVEYVTTKDGISKTFDVYKKYILDNYLYDVDDKKMLESALKGYIEGLGDPYSEYISSDDMKEYMQATTGNYVGIGAYLTTNGNNIIIYQPIKDSPAEEIGLRQGDILYKVDGVEYTASQIDEAATALKQEEGTTVNIEIIRDNINLSYDLVRRRIKINHVESEIYEGNIGYISIVAFDEGTKNEFVQAYNSLKEQNIKSLIIDLRENGGGIVEEAVEIADMMVGKGKTLLNIVSKNKNQETVVSKTEKEIDIPIIVLINQNTASSSEILAAAIKENNANVTLLGTQSYGKGVIQTIYTLSDGSGLKITTNEYFGPNNEKINNRGLSPDVVVKMEDNPNIEGIDTENDIQLNKAIEILKEKN